MDMLVRIDMTGVSAHQVSKHVELAIKLALYRGRIVQGNNRVKRHPVVPAVNPFSEIEMKAETEARIFSCIEGGFTGCQPSVSSGLRS